MSTGTRQPLGSNRDEGNIGRHIDPGTLLGSWEQTVKEDNAWDQDDPDSTIEALRLTKQNFYVYHVDTTAKWERLPMLLRAAHGKKIKIFAAMNSPYLDNSRSCWFDSDPGKPPGLADSPVASTFDDAQWKADRDYMRIWLAAWRAAAMALSHLSLKHDNLVGFVINDFMRFVESADYPAGLDGTQLAKSDITRIYDACHSSNPDFGFYPALTFPDLGRFICRGLILGVDYGVRLHPGESMVVQYDVPLLPDPVKSRLTFFQHSGSGRDKVYRSVWVNGAPVWPKPLHRRIPLNNAGRPVVEHTSLALDLHSGMNRIEIRLDSETFTDGCLVTGWGEADLWYVWDVKLQYWMAGSENPIDFDLLPRFETTTNSDPWRIACWGFLFKVDEPGFHPPGWLSNQNFRCVHKGVFGTPFLRDDPIKGRMARRLICAPNDSYLLEGVIDGILPYVTDTTVYGDYDALDPSGQYARLLSDTKAELGNALLIPIHTALPSGGVVNPDVLLDRLRVAAEVSGAAGVYQFPLGMCFMDASDQRGIFAPYDPHIPIFNLDKLILQWLTDQGSLPGWFQEWVHKAPPTGSVKMTVNISDSRDAGSGPEGMLLKTVRGGGLVTPYEVDPYMDDQLTQTVPLDGSLLSSRASDRVRIRLKSFGSVPNNTKVYAVAHDPLGTPIPKSEFTFNSGVTDPNTLAIYHRLVDFFARVRSP